MPNRIETVASFACCKDIKRFIVYDLDLPFDLNTSLDFHEISIKNLDVVFLSKIKRSIFLKAERYWQESTNICGKDVVEVDISDYKNNKLIYTNIITSLQLIVPVFDEELGDLLKAFKNHDNIALLLSNITYVIKNKFNEVLVTDFISDVSTFGAERVVVYELADDFDRLKMIDGVITPKYSFKQENRMSKGAVQLIKDDSFCMWRLFANKCELAYNQNQNFDCILFAAISIESYVESLFKGFQKENKSDNLFEAIKLLKQENYIDNNEHKRIKSAFGKINRFRNDIVHGKTGTIVQERTKAKIAYETIVDFYFNQPQQSNSTETKNYQKMVDNFRDIVKKIREGDFKSQINNLLKFIDSGYFVQSACFYLGICYFQTRNYNTSKNYFLKCYIAKRYYIQSIYYLTLIARISDDNINMIKLLKEGKEYINSLEVKEKLHIDIEKALDSIIESSDSLPQYRCI